MPLIPVIAGGLAIGAAIDHFGGGGSRSAPGRVHFVPIDDDRDDHDVGELVVGEAFADAHA